MTEETQVHNTNTSTNTSSSSQEDTVTVKHELADLPLSGSKSDSDCPDLANRKRKSFPITDKYLAVQRINNGESRPKVCREMGVAESTLRGWIKGEDSLREALNILEPVKHLHWTAMEDWGQLDTALYTWFLTEHQAGNKISGNLLRAEAEKLYLYFNPTKAAFKSLRRYIQTFKQHHNILSVCLPCGQSDHARLIPNCETIVDFTGDSEKADISADSGVVNHSLNNNTQEYNVGDKRSPASFDFCLSYESVSDCCRPADRRYSTNSNIESATRPNFLPQTPRKPNSKKVVFYLEESLKWLKSKPKCDCSCNSIVEVEKLIDMAKTEAQCEGQKKITDFFS